MPQLTLTDISVRALKPTEKQITYWDAGLSNFGVRVGRRTKTFILLLGNDRQRVTLGRYPAMSLAQARQPCRERLAEQTLGKTAPPASVPFMGFADALNLFFATRSRQNHKASTARENARLLNRHFLSRFQGKNLAAVTTRDVLQVLDSLQDTPSEQAHAFRVLRTFLNFCLKRGYLETSPMARLDAPRASSSCDRVLSNDELSKVWAQAQALGYPYGTIVQLLILTGQRTGEVSAIQWDSRLSAN